MVNTEEQIHLLTSNPNYSPENSKLFSIAIDFARKVLSSKKRLSGDTYFDHNLRVAGYLQDIKASPEVVIAGLVHATIKFVPERELHDLFESRGKDILSLVNGVEDITIIKSRNVKLILFL